MKIRADIRLLPLLLLAAFLSGLVSCGSGDRDKLTIEQVFEARDLLRAYHIRSPAGDDLLNAAWLGLVRRAKLAGVDVTDAESTGSSPFTGYGDGFIEERFLEVYSRLLKQVQSKVDEQLLLEAALFSMGSHTRDGHTAFIPSSTWKRTQDGGGTRQWTPFFLYRVAQTEAGPLVWDVQPGSEAEKGGLRVGDTVVAYDGRQRLGPDYTPLRDVTTFTVERQRVGRLDINVRLEPDSTRPFETRMIGDIAYFELYVFSPLDWRHGVDRIRDSLRRELQALADKRPKGWIVDLRANGGGSADTLAFIAAGFGVDRILYEQHQKPGPPRPVYAGYAGWPGNLRGATPMVVLTVGATVSAGEILAYVLQERHTAYLIGTRTRGSVQGGRRIPLSRGGGFSIAVSRSMVGVDSGFSVNLEGVGVTPDEELALDLDGILRGVDNQLQRAIEYLNGRSAPVPRP